jgi:hypothetical protein
MLLRFKSFLRKCSDSRHKKHCPHMTVAMKRWGPLRAWCRALRGRLRVYYTSEPSQSGLATHSCFQSLVLTLDERVNAISLRERLKIRDAIELVLLALQTSPQDAWEQIVRVLCKTPDFFPVNHLPSELEPRLWVRHLGEYNNFQHNSTNVFASMWASRSRSGSYHRTRKWILASGSDVVASKAVPLKLEIIPTQADAACGSATFLQQTMAMVKILTPAGSIVQLESLALDLRLLRVDSHCCNLILGLQQTGVRIDSLLLAPVNPDLGDPCGGFVTMLDDIANPLQKLCVDNSLRPAPPSVWRALRNSCGLKEVEITQPTRTSQPTSDEIVHVQWQTYALLDARSPTSIERVRFTEGSLSRIDIASMNQVLASANPSELMELPENAEGEIVSCVREKRLRFLQLMTSPAHDEEMGEILRLFRAVGRDLETLTWSVDRAEIKPAHLYELFIACPTLKRLRLQRAQLQEVDTLLAHYESGLCGQLESLTLEDSIVLNRSSLLRFVEACNDPQAAVHRTLRDFAYDNYLHENVLADMIPIIAQNTTLRYIGLRVTAFGLARHRAQLKRLHLAPLAMQKQAPLAIESKITFLQCVRGKLNRDVCHNIFEFAGEGVRRKVVCLVHDWIRVPNRFEL